jgi:hypothetical protein
MSALPQGLLVTIITIAAGKDKRLQIAQMARRYGWCLI